MARKVARLVRKKGKKKGRRQLQVRVKKRVGRSRKPNEPLVEGKYAYHGTFKQKATKS